MPYYLRGPLVSYCSSTIAHFAVIQTINAVWQKNWFYSRMVYICKYVKVAWFSVCTACLAPNISQIWSIISLPHCTFDEWNGSKIGIIFPGMCWSTWGVFLSETPVAFLISPTLFPLPKRSTERRKVTGGHHACPRSCFGYSGGCGWWVGWRFCCEMVDHLVFDWGSMFCE